MKVSILQEHIFNADTYVNWIFYFIQCYNKYKYSEILYHTKATAVVKMTSFDLLQQKI